MSFLGIIKRSAYLLLMILAVIAALATLLAVIAGSVYATYQVMITGIEAPWWAFVGYAGMAIVLVLLGLMGGGSSVLEWTVATVIGAGAAVPGFFFAVGYLGDEVLIPAWVLMGVALVPAVAVIWGVGLVRGLK